MMKKSFYIILTSLFILFYGACTFAKTIKLGESFILKEKGHQSANIDGTNLKITLKGVGHKWFVGDSQGRSSIYCEITINYGYEKKEISIDPGHLVEVGDFVVRLLDAEPFGNKKATFVVRKKIEKYNP